MTSVSPSPYEFLYGVIYGVTSNDKREKDGEPTVQKFNVNKTSIYKIN